MGTRAAWLFNFGAEVELEDPNKVQNQASRARAPELITKCSVLFGPNDLVIAGDASDKGIAEGFVGRAWMPTPRALAALRLAGAFVPKAPAYEVLQRVNDRRFSVGLGATLEGQSIAASIDTIITRMGERTNVKNWVLRRAFGFAGRGRRRARLEEVSGSARSWIEASLRREGSIVVEPWVERMADFGLHGFVSATGVLWLGDPTLQEMTEDGAWIKTRPAAKGELSQEEADSLEATTRQSGEALFAAGYWGPFGLDAFRYRDAKGETLWNPRSEINARYSMGWGIGMGTRRPDLEEPTFPF